MRLVPDAVRDVLLYVEQNQKSEFTVNNAFEKTSLSANSIIDNLTPSKFYSKEEVMTAILTMRDAQILECKSRTGKNGRNIGCDIIGISWNGYQFLETVRPETVWDKTKSVISKVGNHSLSFIESVAHDVSVEMGKEAVKIVMTGQR